MELITVLSKPMVSKPFQLWTSVGKILLSTQPPNMYIIYKLYICTTVLIYYVHCNTYTRKGWDREGTIPDVCAPPFRDHWPKQRLEGASKSSMPPPCLGLEDSLVLLHDPRFRSSSHTLLPIPEDPTDPIFKFTSHLDIWRTAQKAL